MKICLVDGGSSYRDLFLYKKSKYVLASFYHIRKSSFHFFQNNDIFILDSGAFTFMNAKKKETGINWDNYIEEYAEFILKHDIKYFFELDIDVLVGIKEVERLRKKLESLTNRKSIPVWHIHRGMAYFKRMVEEYDYIAIGGLVTKEIQRKDYSNLIKMVDYANANGVKVHGLGFTSMKWLRLIKWYSVDSTSWLGTIFTYRHYEYKNGHMKSTQLKGFDNTKYKDLVKNNYEQWLHFQAYADKHL